MREKRPLIFDDRKWFVKPTMPERTLQIFITNVCNRRCKGCFYDARLGKGHMPIEEYQSIVFNAMEKNGVRKLILLGGEPTAHPQLSDMLRWNESKGLKTTVYTNGTLLHRMEKEMSGISGVLWRIGVLGDQGFEKNVMDVKTSLPVMLVYMLRKDNMEAMRRTLDWGEKNLSLKSFMISSIREIAQTKSFWKDTEETVPNQEYADFVQEFVNSYSGDVPELHISRRGVFDNPKPETERTGCRYLNAFPDGTRITCPLDISLDKRWTGEGFQERECNKDTTCLLQKIVLTRKT